MRYSKLVEVYEKLSGTTKRLEKIKILSNFLQTIPDDDFEVLYLLLGDIYAGYDDRKIGISDKLVIKAIAKTFGIPDREVVKKWKQVGDLGEVAEFFSNSRKQTTFSKSSLTTKKVLSELRKLPELEGSGTINKKLSIISGLLTDSEPIESKYLIRTLLGDLRIGVLESTIRDAICEAFFNGDKKMSEVIQNALDKRNDIAEIFILAKNKKISLLENIKIEVGKPLKVMLAQKADSFEEGFEKVGKPCAIEYKYDGFRMLIHKKGDNVWIFTRRLENVTKQFPEVVDYVKKYVRGNSFILDSEAIGYDKRTKRYKPFQEISQRIKRKYHIEKLMEELPVEVNVFDILYYNGKSLIDKPFIERTRLLDNIIKNEKYKLVKAKQIITSSLKEAKTFFNKALKDNQEGVMMKNLNAVYKPGSRVGYMLKIKPSGNDFDLVITGAEYGTGKRSGWFSSFVLSCLDERSGSFMEVGKVSTGLKEKESEGISFDELTRLLKPHVISIEGRKVKIAPKVVVSVAYQEIQKSPNYESGFALRFPRFTALRPERSPKDITTLKEIKQEYERSKKS